MMTGWPAARSAGGKEGWPGPKARVAPLRCTNRRRGWPSTKVVLFLAGVVGHVEEQVQARLGQNLGGGRVVDGGHVLRMPGRGFILPDMQFGLGCALDLQCRPMARAVQRFAPTEAAQTAIGQRDPEAGEQHVAGCGLRFRRPRH